MMKKFLYHGSFAALGIGLLFCMSLLQAKQPVDSLADDSAAISDQSTEVVPDAAAVVPAAPAATPAGRLTMHRVASLL